MMTVTKMNNHKIRPVKLALFCAALIPILAGCNGIEAASKSSERLAYRLNFQQVPLIASNSTPGRVLNMHVFSVTGTQQVPFHAELSPS